jgi:hypothetical protein
MRVCQFRHDGKWTSIVATAQGRRIRKTCMSILQAGRSLSNDLPRATFTQGHPTFGREGHPMWRRCHPEEGDSPPRDLTKRLKRQYSRQDCVRWMHRAFPNQPHLTLGPRTVLPASSPLFRMTTPREQLQSSSLYSSFAFIVIFAFSTLETGQPFSAASAYFWKVAASAPGTLPTTSM